MMLRAICVVFFGFALSLNSLAKTQSDDSIFLAYEERVLLAYALLAAGETPEQQSEIALRALQYAAKVKEKGVRKIQVQSFEEFLKVYRGPWPNAHSVEANLEVIENSDIRAVPLIFSEKPSVQAQIQNYFERKNNFLGDQLSAVALQRGAISGDAKKLIQDRFQEISLLGKELLQSQPAMKNLDGFGIFISFALSEYFQNLSLDSQKQIISQILGEDLRATPLKKFEIMVLNSGPQFQKLLQVVARESTLPQDMIEVFKKLESLTMPVPEYFVKKALADEKTNYNFMEFDFRPLGVGTMAQVHQAVMTTEKGPQKVVVRFIKPDIEKRIQEDHGILTKLAPILDAHPELINSGFAKIAPLAEDLTQTAQDELQLSLTIQNQKLGRESYNRVIHSRVLNRDILVRVPKIFEAQAKNSKLIVQELVYGFKLDQLQERHRKDSPNLKKEITLELAKLWLRVLLFENGFFHSDLHQGNIMIDFGNKVIPMNILDFGMSGQLSKNERLNFLYLAVASEMNLPKVMAEAMIGISNVKRNEIRKSELEKMITEKMQELDQKKMVLSPERWIAWAINRGVRFSPQIIGVSRGFTILDRLLKNADTGTTVLELSRSLAKEQKWDLFNVIRKNEYLGFTEYIEMGLRAAQGRRAVDKSPLEAPPVLAPFCRSVLSARQ